MFSGHGEYLPNERIRELYDVVQNFKLGNDSPENSENQVSWFVSRLRKINQLNLSGSARDTLQNKLTYNLQDAIKAAMKTYFSTTILSTSLP